MPDGRLPVQYETKRLILRPYTEADALWYYQMSLRNRHHLLRYESGNVAMSLTSEEHTRTTLRRLDGYWVEGTCYFAGAFTKTSGEFVAQVYAGLFNREPVEYIIGYIADHIHEGSGYVTEAVTATVENIFGYLGTDRVRIHCDQTNARSLRVAERCGFHNESSFLEKKTGPDHQLHTCTTEVYLRSHRAHFGDTQY